MDNCTLKCRGYAMFSEKVVLSLKKVPLKNKTNGLKMIDFFIFQIFCIFMCFLQDNLWIYSLCHSFLCQLFFPDSGVQFQLFCHCVGVEVRLIYIQSTSRGENITLLEPQSTPRPLALPYFTIPLHDFWHCFNPLGSTRYVVIKFLYICLNMWNCHSVKKSFEVCLSVQ